MWADPGSSRLSQRSVEVLPVKSSPIVRLRWQSYSLIQSDLGILKRLRFGIRDCPARETVPEDRQ